MVSWGLKKCWQRQKIAHGASRVTATLPRGHVTCMKATIDPFYSISRHIIFSLANTHLIWIAPAASPMLRLRVICAAEEAELKTSLTQLPPAGTVIQLRRTLRLLGRLDQGAPATEDKGESIESGVQVRREVSLY